MNDQGIPSNYMFNIDNQQTQMIQQPLLPTNHAFTYNQQVPLVAARTISPTQKNYNHQMHPQNHEQPIRQDGQMPENLRQYAVQVSHLLDGNRNSPTMPLNSQRHAQQTNHLVRSQNNMRLQSPQMSQQDYSNFQNQQSKLPFYQPVAVIQRSQTNPQNQMNLQAQTTSQMQTPRQIHQVQKGYVQSSGRMGSPSQVPQGFRPWMQTQTPMHSPSPQPQTMIQHQHASQAPMDFQQQYPSPVSPHQNQMEAPSPSQVQQHAQVYRQQHTQQPSLTIHQKVLQNHNADARENSQAQSNHQLQAQAQALNHQFLSQLPLSPSQQMQTQKYQQRFETLLQSQRGSLSQSPSRLPQMTSASQQLRPGNHPQQSQQIPHSPHSPSAHTNYQPSGYNTGVNTWASEPQTLQTPRIMGSSTPSPRTQQQSMGHNMRVSSAPSPLSPQINLSGGSTSPSPRYQVPQRGCVAVPQNAFDNPRVVVSQLSQTSPGLNNYGQIDSERNVDDRGFPNQGSRSQVSIGHPTGQTRLNSRLMNVHNAHLRGPSPSGNSSQVPGNIAYGRPTRTYSQSIPSSGPSNLRIVETNNSQDQSTAQPRASHSRPSGGGTPGRVNVQSPGLNPVTQNGRNLGSNTYLKTPPANDEAQRKAVLQGVKAVGSPYPNQSESNRALHNGRFTNAIKSQNSEISGKPVQHTGSSVAPRTKASSGPSQAAISKLRSPYPPSSVVKRKREENNSDASVSHLSKSRKVRDLTSPSRNMSITTTDRNDQTETYHLTSIPTFESLEEQQTEQSLTDTAVVQETIEDLLRRALPPEIERLERVKEYRNKYPKGFAVVTNDPLVPPGYMRALPYAGI